MTKLIVAGIYLLSASLLISAGIDVWRIYRTTEHLGQQREIVQRLSEIKECSK